MKNDHYFLKLLQIVLCLRRVWDCVRIQRGHTLSLGTQSEISWALSWPNLPHSYHVMSLYLRTVCGSFKRSLAIINRPGPPILMPPRWHDVTTDSPHRTYPNRVRSSLAFSDPRFLSGSEMHRLGTPESTLLLTCITKKQRCKNLAVETAQVNFTPVSRHHMTKPSLPVQHCQT